MKISFYHWSMNKPKTAKEELMQVLIPFLSGLFGNLLSGTSLTWFSGRTSSKASLPRMLLKFIDGS